MTATTTLDVAAALTPWLARRLGATALRIDGLRRHTEGWSWQTFTFEAHWTDGDGAQHREGFAVRREPEDGLLAPYDVAAQHALHGALAGAGLPLPALRWLELDASVLGMPFSVAERVEGVVPTQYRPVFKSDQERVALGHAFVDLLADVHAVDLKAVSDLLPVPASPAAIPAIEIARWRAIYEEFALEPVAPLEHAFGWLEANAVGSGRRTLCHGDYRIGNFMTDGGSRIVALFDWELAHVGDPAEDVAFAGLRLFRGRSPRFSHLLEGDAFLDRYERATGLRIAPEVLAFWTVLSYVKAATNYLRAARAFESGANPDLRLAAMGHQLMFLLKQLRRELPA
jgi:aminoglycoside phosphotransferase (APT) family kinase protein